MEKYLKIESKDPKNTILLNDDYFNSLKITFESPDETEKKIDQIGNMIEIRGQINTYTQQYSAMLSKWALMKSTDPEAYRKLTLWIIGENNKIYRKIEYPYCFLIDYIEEYGGLDENKREKSDNFILKIKQKQDELSKIVITADGKVFNAESSGFGDKKRSDKKAG